MTLVLALALFVQATPFDHAVAAYAGCLRATVQMGMRTWMDPAVFRQGFARSCMPEEALFRDEAVKVAIEQGRTREQAIAEVNGNIANGRRIFAADRRAMCGPGGCRDERKRRTIRSGRMILPQA